MFLSLVSYVNYFLLTARSGFVNNGSTMLSQLLDTLIFTSIAFLGVYPTDVWISIFISTYVLKFLVSIVGTPFGYLAKRITPVDEK